MPEPQLSKYVKVCIAGPSESGKTAITRFLADWDPFPSSQKPTVGVRVQEIERKVGTDVRQIQLWDCSGDAKYQSCWPAMARGAQGLILVYNPDDDTDQEKQLEKWYQTFAYPNILAEGQCHIVAARMKQGDSQPPKKTGMQGNLKKLKHTVINLSDDASRAELFSVIDTVLLGIVERQKAIRDDEERKIIEG